VLAAMRRHGLSVSSNHNPGRQNQLHARDSCEVFLHANGVLEVPISVLHRDGDRFEFNFNQHGFANSVEWFADSFWNRYDDRSILNLVMHSRSFLVMDARKRFYVPKDAQPMALFRSVLDRLQAWQTEVIGISQWADAWRGLRVAARDGMGNEVDSPAQRQFSSATVMPQAALSAVPEHAADRSTRPEHERGPAPAVRPACPVCGDPKRLFVDFNGRRLARCASCAALERQRSLVQAWNASFRHDVLTEGRTALLVSPAKSERLIFAALGFRSLQTLDVRPEARCDIVADLCSMPQVRDGSFDLVFASHVLPHVHDLEAALYEIARILTPDGVFLSFTPVRVGQPTTVAEGQTQASGWYGADIMQKHQVGSFRSFGDLGLLRDLQRHFVVKTAMGEDPVTGRLLMWTCGWTLSAADRGRSFPKDGRRYVPLQRARGAASEFPLPRQSKG
jgi:SAM-dependent methyltransferase